MRAYALKLKEENKRLELCEEEFFNSTSKAGRRPPGEAAAGRACEAAEGRPWSEAAAGSPWRLLNGNHSN
jgi:hypothetical protein